MLGSGSDGLEEQNPARTPFLGVYPAEGQVQLQLCHAAPDAHPLPHAEGNVGEGMDGAPPEPALGPELSPAPEILLAAAQGMAVDHQHRLQQSKRETGALEIGPELPRDGKISSGMEKYSAGRVIPKKLTGTQKRSWFPQRIMGKFEIF